VRDKGIPAKTSTTPVTITIQRIGDIKFSQSEYDITIRESDHNNGDDVYSITATDPLAGVSKNAIFLIFCCFNFLLEIFLKN